MIQTMRALSYLRLLLETAGTREAPAPTKPRRKLKARRKPYAGPVRLNASAPILEQLRGGR